MTEPQCRAVAAGIVAAARRKAVDIRQMSVVPHDGGARVVVTLADGLMLELDIPVGHFSYDRAVAMLQLAMGRATVET